MYLGLQVFKTIAIRNLSIYINLLSCAKCAKFRACVTMKLQECTSILFEKNTVSYVTRARGEMFIRAVGLRHSATFRAAKFALDSHSTVGRTKIWRSKTRYMLRHLSGKKQLLRRKWLQENFYSIERKNVLHSLSGNRTIRSSAPCSNTLHCIVIRNTEILYTLQVYRFSDRRWDEGITAPLRPNRVEKYEY